MGELTINKKIGKTLVLFDTCSYEAMVKGIEKEKTKEAIKLLSKDNHIGVITDLTFAELVVGRETLKEYDSFRSKFLSLGFGIFGHSDIMSTIGSNALDKSFKNEDEYQIFRKKMIKMKQELEKPLFKLIVLKYTVLFFTVFAEYDKLYFSPLVHLATELLSNHSKEMDIIWSDLFDAVVFSNEKEQKECLYDACVALMEAMAETHKPGYIKNEIQEELLRLNALNKLSVYTSKMVKKYKLKDEFKKFGGLNNIEFLMYVLSLNKIFHLNEDAVEFDGTSYSAIMSGFCQGKFQYNDLVDIYNASFVANAQEKFIYFTEETRWLKFIELEKRMGRI